MFLYKSDYARLYTRGRTFALTENHAVVRVAHKLVPAGFQLCIQFMKHNIAQQGTQRASLDCSMNTALVVTVYHYPGEKVFMDEGDNTTILHGT